MVQHRAIALLLRDGVALWGRSFGYKFCLFLILDAGFRYARPSLRILTRLVPQENQNALNSMVLEWLAVTVVCKLFLNTESLSLRL
jgi:hypothetical protein